MVSIPRSAMRSVQLLNNNPGQAPENLIAFIDGRTFSSPDPQELESERPKKKRKVSGPDTSKTPLHSSGPDDYLTLARVDITMVSPCLGQIDCTGLP